MKHTWKCELLFYIQNELSQSLYQSFSSWKAVGLYNPSTDRRENIRYIIFHESHLKPSSPLIHFKRPISQYIILIDTLLELEKASFKAFPFSLSGAYARWKIQMTNTKRNCITTPPLASSVDSAMLVFSEFCMNNSQLIKVSTRGSMRRFWGLS